MLQNDNLILFIQNESCSTECALANQKTEVWRRLVLLTTLALRQTKWRPINGSRERVKKFLEAPATPTAKTACQLSPLDKR